MSDQTVQLLQEVGSAVENIYLGVLGNWISGLVESQLQGDAITNVSEASINELSARVQNLIAADALRRVTAGQKAVLNIFQNYLVEGLRDPQLLNEATVQGYGIIEELLSLGKPASLVFLLAVDTQLAILYTRFHDRHDLGEKVNAERKIQDWIADALSFQGQWDSWVEESIYDRPTPPSEGP
jgi:hypothetical protein